MSLFVFVCIYYDGCMTSEISLGSAYHFFWAWEAVRPSGWERGSELDGLHSNPIPGPVWLEQTCSTPSVQ